MTCRGFRHFLPHFSIQNKAIEASEMIIPMVGNKQNTVIETWKLEMVETMILACFSWGLSP